MRTRSEIKLSHSYSAIKMFENCPYRYYRQRVVKDVVDQPNQYTIYGERIHKHLEDRIKDKTPLPEESAKFESLCQRIENMGDVHCEKELVLNKSLKPTGWWDEDAWLRSKLDVLVFAGDEAVVMDYKTGKRRPDFFQMEIFAAQVFRHYPQIDKVKTALVWLKDGAMDKETYIKPKASQLLVDLVTRIQRIEQALKHDKWPARPSGLCNFCPARSTCEYA